MTGAPLRGEVWVKIPNHPLYMVSNHGRVRAIRTNAPILKGDRDRKGYRRVLLDRRHKRVNRLVCEAFHGPCPTGRECAHLDGDVANDAADNLAWLTPSENNLHKRLHGTVQTGERTGRARLTKCQVEDLRKRAAQGASERQLASAYGISPSHAHRIITKEAWHA